MAIYPTPEQIQSLLAGPADQPVVMLNLLRFKPRADAPDDGISGEEAYRRYADLMQTFVESKGGRFLWIGQVDSQVIGTGGEGFHVIGLVEYPSRRAFHRPARPTDRSAPGRRSREPVADRCDRRSQHRNRRARISCVTRDEVA